MRCLVIFALAMLSANAFSASAQSNTGDDFYKTYSVVSAKGKLPVRDVVLKRTSESFTSYRGFQLNCVTRQISDTGFYGSVKAAQRSLSTLKPSSTMFKLLTENVWKAACDTGQRTVINDSAQPSTVS